MPKKKIPLPPEHEQTLNVDTTTKNHGRPLPPVATRFRKGKSGNPKGRPRKQGTISKLVLDTLAQTCVSDTERRTFAELFVRTILQAAIRGDVSALKIVWERHDGKLPPPNPNEGKITWDDMTTEERKNWSKGAIKIFDAIWGLDRGKSEENADYTVDPDTSTEEER